MAAKKKATKKKAGGNGASQALAAPPKEKALSKGEADLFAASEGMGLETVTAQDLLIPRLLVAQKLSPQLDAQSSSFIEAASEGDICDTGTNDTFAQVTFLPAIYRKSWIEWAPRKSQQGGPVKIHDNNRILAQCKMDDRRRAFLPNGNQIIDTMQFFGYNLMYGKPMACFVAMTATQLKKGRMWLNLSTGEELSRPDGSRYTPPFFFRTYTLETQPEANAEGSWYGWAVSRGITLAEWSAENGRKLEDMFSLASGLHRAIAEGSAAANMSRDSDPATGKAAGIPDEDDIPL